MVDSQRSLQKSGQVTLSVIIYFHIIYIGQMLDNILYYYYYVAKTESSNLIK